MVVDVWTSRWLLAVVLAVLLMGAGPASTSTAAPSTGPVDAAAVDRLVGEQMRRHGIPGLSLAVIEDGRISYVQGYGTAAAGREVTPATAMPVGSMTKPITAVAVLQLAQAGRVELDAPVQRYVPWFEVADPEASRTITVRQLLNHTSGLSDAGYRRLLPADATLEAGVRDLRHARPSAQPGQVHQYFNPNYAVLAVLIQEVTGRSYVEVVREGIFVPLGMADSTADPSAAPEGVAQGHITLFGVPIRADAPVRHHRDGADGVVATASDLARFATAVAMPSPRSPAVLSADSLAQLVTPPDLDGVRYGLGWEVSEHRGERVVGHRGLDPTFAGEMAMLPERGSGYVLLTNQGHLLETTVAMPQLRAGLLDLLADREPDPGGWPWRGLGAALFVAFGVVVFFSLRTLLRLPAWPRRAHVLPPGRRAWEIGSHVLSAAVLVLLMYWLVPMLIDRSFNLAEIGRYHLPDVTLLVAVSVVTDVIAAVVMLAVVLLHRRGESGLRSSEPAARATPR